MSRPQALAVLLGFALVALSPPLIPPLDRPAWTVGDTWTYETDTALMPGLNLTGTVTSTVVGQVPTLVAGASVDAYRVLLAGSGSAAGTVHLNSGNVTIQGSWVLTGDERFEPTNLDLIYDLLDLSVNGTYQTFLPFSLRVQNTTTYYVRADDWRYPLAAGTNGSRTVDYNFTQDAYSTGGSTHASGVGEWTFGFSMGAPTTVSTPAGSFSAYPITETWPDGSAQRTFSSPQVGNAVRTESYAPGGNRTAVTSLTSYRYQVLETTTYLGLTALEWAAVSSVIVAGVVITVVWRWRRRRSLEPPEGGSPPILT